MRPVEFFFFFPNTVVTSFDIRGRENGWKSRYTYTVTKPRGPSAENETCALAAVSADSCERQKTSGRRAAATRERRRTRPGGAAERGDRCATDGGERDPVFGFRTLSTISATRCLARTTGRPRAPAYSKSKERKKREQCCNCSFKCY